MKQNEVSDDALHLYLFPYSLKHHAIAIFSSKYDEEISLDDMMRKFLSKYFPPSMDTSATRDETSRNISSTTIIESPEVVRQLEMMNKNFLDMMRQIQSVKYVSLKCETCGGPYSFTECPAVGGYTQKAAYATTGNYNSGVERETEATNDKVQTTSSESTTHVQPPIVQVPIQESEVAPKPKPKPSIPYPSRINDQKLREKANNQMLKFLQIFQKLHFDISFMDALLYMPKFASTFKNLLSNKEKLFELAKTLLNENCSTVLLKKLRKKLRDPGMFLIPCDFLKLDECLALADLGASINLMPLPVENCSLSELNFDPMTPILADRSVDYDVDPRVPFILGRPFLRTARALIDVYGEELTIRVDNEAITFKVGQTLRDSHSYETINQVNVIDVACEEYAQEVLGFSDSLSSGNPTPSDPIIASSSHSFTLLKEEISFWKNLRLFYVPRKELSI
ncbi:hypothetical protein Tco_0897048 [Tanacetum coccineum]